MHAAALHPELFVRTQLEKTIGSWERIFEPAITHRQLEGVVHGVLRHYDLPNLAALAGNTTFGAVVDATGAPSSR